MKLMFIFKVAKIEAKWRESVCSGYRLRPSPTGYTNAKLFYYEYTKYLVKFPKEVNILTGNNKVLLLLGYA